MLDISMVLYSYYGSRVFTYIYILCIYIYMDEFDHDLIVTSLEGWSIWESSPNGLA